MAIQETNEERKKRLKAMSSDERKALIRKKLKDEGLEEGSGVPGKDLSSYDQAEIWELIQITSRFPEMQNKARKIKSKTPNKRSLITWILLTTTLAWGMVLFYKQYPSAETRKEISAEVMFFD